MFISMLCYHKQLVDFFLDAIASLDYGYESKRVRIIKANNEYIVKH